ncbi:MAG: methylated-DNA--[protein]-cysteine S-methyltransferase [Solirubrobacteraceae bacterium]
MIHTSIDSPLGELLLVGDGRALHGLYVQEGPHPLEVPAGWEPAGDGFAAVARALDEYFSGARVAFDVPLALRGSAFQLRVWEALCTIPYGTTVSYGAIAEQVGSESARAVGRANGSNPIPVIVPCHRVIGAAGTLTGYGGGLERKRWLLDLEAGQAQLAV